ncbi:NAD-dependent epimerase/dehydratase family protein [Nocardioides gansuensis]|uniref:NAD-dependent epimerase/dehydratase family protein n=1 Tax=Nocardioides gansuensis TaxID=2138300 RepID=UPI001FE27FC8|nr:NAD-dependent epimerase/dehydratase family protein [Nocardioides gansuensis]
MTSAVVTGGAGFVGSHLCDRLLGAGVRVIAVDNLLSGSSDNLAQARTQPAFSLVRGDIADTGTLAEVPDDVDLVFHLASPASPVAYREHPVATLRAGIIGTFNALELARRAGARFVLASTSEVYGDPLVHPQPESYRGNVSCVGERAMYDEAKRFAEAATTTVAAQPWCRHGHRAHLQHLRSAHGVERRSGGAHVRRPGPGR